MRYSAIVLPSVKKAKSLCFEESIRVWSPCPKGNKQFQVLGNNFLGRTSYMNIYKAGAQGGNVITDCSP